VGVGGSATVNVTVSAATCDGRNVVRCDAKRETTPRWRHRDASTARWMQWACPARRAEVPRASVDHAAKTATAVRLRRRTGLVLWSAFVVVLETRLRAEVQSFI
jgi:hypothetical protein